MTFKIIKPLLVVITVIGVSLVIDVGCAKKKNPSSQDLSSLTDSHLTSIKSPYQGYKLVWADEFDGSTLNTNNWLAWDKAFLPPYSQWNKESFMSSVFSPKQIEVDNGLLLLKASPVPGGGQTGGWSTQQNKELWGYTFTSGALNSLMDGAQAGWLYGRFDAMIRFPCTTGIFPAFWLLPVQSQITGVSGQSFGWPTSGEIDGMEYRGSDPCNVYTQAHFSITQNNAIQETQAGATINFLQKTNPICGKYHLFSVIWTPTTLSGAIDNQLTYTLQATQADKNWSPLASWPFDKPFYIIIDYAIGGWGDNDNPKLDPNSESVMEIDFVRVYQMEQP